MELFYMKESLLLDECDDIVESVRLDTGLFLENGEEPKKGIFNRLAEAISKLITKIKNFFTNSKKKEEKVKELTSQLGDNSNKIMHVVDIQKIENEYNKANKELKHSKNKKQVVEDFKRKLIKFGIPAAIIGVTVGVIAHANLSEIKAARAHEEWKRTQELLDSTNDNLERQLEFLNSKLESRNIVDKTSGEKIVKDAKNQKRFNDKSEEDKELADEIQETLYLANVMIKTQNYSSDLIISELTDIVRNGGDKDDIKKYRNDLDEKKTKYLDSIFDQKENLNIRKQNYFAGKQYEEEHPKKKGFIKNIFKKESTMDEVLNERTEDILKELLDD